MPDGHSFSSGQAAGDGWSAEAFARQLDPLLPAGWSAEAVEFELDTARTVLLPEALTDNDSAARCLALNNLFPEAWESVVVMHSPGGEIAAAALWNRAEAEYLRERFGRALSFASPLLRFTWRAGRCLSLHLTGANVYICAFEGKMKYGAVFPAASPADTLYYMETLGEIYPADEWPVRVSGPGARETVKAIRRYFGRVDVKVEEVR